MRSLWRLHASSLASVLPFLRTLRQRRVSWPQAKIAIASSPRSRTRSSRAAVQSPASSHAAASSVSARKRGDVTASCARASAASRFCARACETDGRPSQCAWLTCTGDDALDQNVELPRRAQLRGKPFELGLDRLRLRIAQKTAEQRHRRAQPAQADAHLVHPLGIDFDEGRLIADDLLEARATDDPESFARGGAGRKLYLHGLDWRIQAAVHERVAALRFAPDAKLSGKPARELARFLKQLHGVAALELKLDLAHWHRASAGLDRSSIDGKRECTRVVGNRIDGPAHPCLELRLEPQLVICQGLER